MKFILVVVFGTREAKAFQLTLPSSKTDAPPLWTWFIENPRLVA